MVKRRQTKGNVCKAMTGREIKKTYGVRSRLWKAWRDQCKK